MADANASGTLRLNRDFVVISHQARSGSASPDTTVRAERGQPVAACRFLEGNLILYQPLVRSSWVCRQVSNRPRVENFCVSPRGLGAEPIPNPKSATPMWPTILFRKSMR